MEEGNLTPEKKIREGSDLSQKLALTSPLQVWALGADSLPAAGSAVGGERGALRSGN